ncbi:MAG: hypothetical protein RSC27_00690 [Bacilli bacterium]
MKKLYKMSIILFGLIPFLSGCIDLNASTDYTGTKEAKVLGFNTKLYEEINSSYNDDSPIKPNKSNITHVDYAKTYFLVVNIDSWRRKHSSKNQ